MPMLVKIFLPGGKSAADVALGLVFRKDRLDLYVQGTVACLQPFREILVYGGF